MSKSTPSKNSLVAVVTGASRGIGLGMVKGLLSKPGQEWTIIATARKPDEAKSLTGLKDKFPTRLHILPLVVDDDKSIDAFVAEVKKLTKNVDLLVNNAGMMNYKSGLELTTAEMQQVFTVNTIAPMTISQKLYPLLKAAKVEGVCEEKSDSGKTTPTHLAKVLNITSMLALTKMHNADVVKSFGGAMLTAYRASKMAQNVVTASLALSCPDVVFIAQSPGWVKTEMGGENAPMTVEQSVAGMLACYDKVGIKDSGKFFNPDGTIEAF